MWNRLCCLQQSFPFPVAQAHKYVNTESHRAVLMIKLWKFMVSISLCSMGYFVDSIGLIFVTMFHLNAPNVLAFVKSRWVRIRPKCECIRSLLNRKRGSMICIHPPGLTQVTSWQLSQAESVIHLCHQSSTVDLKQVGLHGLVLVNK